MKKEKNKITKLKYSKTITSLRGVSVMGVLLYHSKYPIFTGGFLGVDVFFVISGFLIGNIIFSELSNNKLNFINFYLRRIRRLIPSLIFTILIAYVISYFIFLPEDFINFKNSILYTVFFVGNIYFWKTNDYFSPSTDISPLSHLWSLAIEEQFYLFFPLLIFFIRKNNFLYKNIKSILLLSVFFSFIYTVAEFYHLPVDCPTTNCIEVTNFYWLHTRAWEILAGVSLNLFIINREYFKNQLLNIGFILILFSFLLFDSTYRHPGYATLPTIIGTVMVIVSSLNNDNNYLSNSKILYFLGKISYSLYLIHFPLFVIRNYFGFKIVVSPGFDILPLFIILISILLSYYMWLYIETPFRDRNTISNKKLILSAASGVFLLMIIVSTPLIPNKKLNTNYENFNFSTDFNIKKECFFEFVPQSLLEIDNCLKPQQNTENVLVIGSSVAKNIYKGLSTLNQDKTNFDLIVVTGCPPFVASYSSNIQNFDENKCEVIYGQISKNLESKYYSKIIISYQWQELIFKEFAPNESLFDHTIKNIVSSIPNERIMIVGPPVRWENRMEIIALRSSNLQENFSQYSNLYLDRKIFNSEEIFVQKMNNLKLDYFSLVDFFCIEERCKLYEKVDTTYFFTSKDFIHITDYFTSKLATNIYPKLKK